MKIRNTILLAGMALVSFKANASDWLTQVNNCIACGVLLGFVFSCYKDSAYSWTDSAQGSFVLNEANLATMVLKMCKNELTTDYLSTGSIIWQNFRPYIMRILLQTL